MRLEINTNGAWRVVSAFNHSDKEAVKVAVIALMRLVFDTPSWRISDGPSIGAEGKDELAHLDPRRHGLVWQERKR